MNKRIAAFKETIKNQRLQIHDLHQENNRLQDREDDHQELNEAFDRLDRYTKRMTEKNKKLKNFW